MNSKHNIKKMQLLCIILIMCLMLQSGNILITCNTINQIPTPNTINQIPSRQSDLPTPQSTLTSTLSSMITSCNLKGLQIQVTKSSQPLYHNNFGYKSINNTQINNKTIFFMASLSKSITSFGILQLVDQGKLKLNDSISQILGYYVYHPDYPNINITIQMILSHQSSISENYSGKFGQFINETYNAKNGYEIPQLKQILTINGKYYDPQMYPKNRKPGEYFRYSNLNYVIAGTIIQIISGKRFDVFMQENILNYLNDNYDQQNKQSATFNLNNIKDYKNIATIFQGDKNHKWIPIWDYYNDTIKQKNMTGYKIGKNGAVFGPHDSLRANVFHLNNYMYILSNKGITKSGIHLLSQKSILQLIKPRYQYHGPASGNQFIFHQYGLGIFATTYSPVDIIIQHEVVRGHLGSEYNMISAYFYWKNYTFSYVVNGALDGYEHVNRTFYQKERIIIHKAVNQFVQDYQKSCNEDYHRMKQII